MFVWLKDENGEPHTVEVEEVDFNCNNMTLPILPNIVESNEETVVQIWYILKEYVKFLDDKVRFAGTFSMLPNCVVEKLNLQSKLLYDYFFGIGVRKYLPSYFAEEIRHSSPSRTVPSCQYMYDKCKKILEVIEEKFQNIGLRFDNLESQEEDW